MEIREIQNRTEWEGFLEGCRDKTFLQSWNWGEFQEKLRGKIWRFGFYESGELIAVALAVKVEAKRGTFLLVPHGPVVKIFNFSAQGARLPDGQGPGFEGQTSTSNEIQDLNHKITEILLQKLKELAKNEEAAFVRINPIFKRTRGNAKIFKDLGFREAPIQMHPEASWKLDISPSEDDLLKNMRKTTRYLIKQAQKDKDIEVSQGADLGDVKIFSEMHKKVSLRQKFVPFSLEYLENEFKSFDRDGEILIFWGKYGNDIAAASFVVFWSKFAFYHHAASLPQYAKFSLPYLLQWEAIKEAKKRNCVLYDFWGYVNPKTQPKHPWAGPTLFKMGFGGSAEEYVKTQDFPITKKYWITYFFEKIRKIKRGL